MVTLTDTLILSDILTQFDMVKQSVSLGLPYRGFYDGAIFLVFVEVLQPALS